jgi:Pyruvate/2-oxoglutarate dehydrogenase complex, dihydrolipoamide acyltransferase (E2) component, and related enzymes
MALKEFKMPEIAESVHEGEIGKILVKEGDYVKREQPLLEVLTDKVNTELPSPYEGYVIKILVKEGDVVSVGTPLIIIGDRFRRY